MVTHRDPSERNNKRIIILAIAIVLAAMSALAGGGPADAQQASKARCAGKVATITGTPGPDVLRGTPRADVIAGLGGDDIIMGLAGNDIICGGGGNDELVGGAGNDRLIGGNGNDKMIANRGNDRLEGGKGNDIHNGGPGKDTCLGGFGSDTGNSCEVKRAILKKTLVTQRQGQLRSEGSTSFKFRAEKGEQLYINFDEELSSRFDGRWELTLGTKELASNYLVDAGDTFTAERTGWYTMTLTERKNTPKYKVQILRAPTLVRPLKVGVAHRDRIGIPGEKHALRFKAEAGDLLYLDWDDIENIHGGSFALYPVQGFDKSAIAELSRLDDQDDAIRIPRSGTYDLVIDGDNDNLFTYSVKVAKVTRKVKTARIGQTISGEIATAGEVDVLRINGTAGQKIVLDWGETGRYDGDWTLIEVGGFDNEVASSGSFSEDADGFVLPANGRYDLVIDGDDDNTFGWTVTIN